MFIGMMLSGFLFLAVVLIALALAANAVWRAVMPPAGLPRRAGCGSCGYELSTLTAGRCSECGADLLKSGVVTRHNVVRTAGSLPAALLGWTLIAMSLGVIVLYTVSIVFITSNSGSGTIPYTSNYTFRPARTSSTPSQAPPTPPDFRLNVNVDVTGNFGSSASSGTISLELSLNNNAAVFTFPDARRDAWTLTAPDGSQLAAAEGLRADDVLAAFAALGLLPADHPDLPEYAERIAELGEQAYRDPFNYEATVGSAASPSTVRIYQAGGSSNYGGTNPFTGAGTPADYLLPLAVLGVTGLIWAGGMFFIIRRRARLIEGPRDDAPTVAPTAPAAPADPAA